MDDEPQAHQTRCRLGTTDVICSRLRPGPPMTITWQLLELAQGLAVQRGGGGPCPNMPVTLSTTVDPALSISLSVVSGAGLNLDDEDFTVSRLVTTGPSTQLALEPPGACNAYDWQVATLTGISVLRGTAPGFGTGNMRLRSLGGLPAASANTVVLTQLAATSGLPTNAPMCNYFGRGVVASPTSLEFTRGANAPPGSCDMYSSGLIHWQRIDFGSRARVQQFTVSMTTGDATAVQPILTVDPSRTLTFLGTQAMQGLALGETADITTGNDALGPMSATTELTSPTSVLLTRDGLDEAVIFTLYVVELVP